MALAIADASSPEFDRAVRLVVDRPAARAVPYDVAAAFSRYDYGAGIRGVTVGLWRSWNCDYVWAEEAVQDALTHLYATKRELFVRHPDTWMKLLYKVAYNQLIKNRREVDRVDSMEWLWADGGDDAFQRARAALPASIEGVDEDAKYLPPPGPGESWERVQMIGAAQRFRDLTGRPPTQEECRGQRGRELGLPPASAIAREFDSYNEFLLEAGMTPRFTARTRTWTAIEAAKECASWRRRNSCWPGRAEIDRVSNGLPPKGVCEKYFGGYRAIDIQLGVEAILSQDEIHGRC
jgi:DNA-directed RNA polymerase specialized sigma24 family protein